LASDIQWRPARDLIGWPLPDRRARLEDVVAGNELVSPVRRLASDGPDRVEPGIQRGYEGYVAKAATSPYEQGPTRRRLK
jgi:ATP-dependent DNA ligase